jgi:dTDP-4-amino-4,6-dideoxygalactose transaminase/dTDP-4-dehydrorhamnose 3,5-epimerase-like enzyme
MEARIIKLPRVTDPRGNLSFIEQCKEIPFEIKRVFYIYDVPAGESRGTHAHKTNNQLIVAASGSFDVFLDDGITQKTVTLNRPFEGLYVPAGIWTQEQSFSSGALCLVLTDDFFDEDDYIRDHDEYIKYLSENKISKESSEQDETVKFLELKKVSELHLDGLHAAAQRVIDSGWYLQGREVANFEKQYADFIGSKHCIAVANGLDALRLILRAYIEMSIMRPGDEVIVPANTYIASILAITDNNLVPVLVEPKADTFQIDEDLIEQAITPKTKAVMIVHLYGRDAYAEKIGDICKRHNLKLIEDNAQAAGCRHINWQSAAPHEITRTGNIGDAAGNSFYPGKNLGALGDSGAVTTNDDELAAIVRALANYGSDKKYVFKYCGLNSRMDEIQAAFLAEKLTTLDEENQARKMIAAFYDKNLSGLPGISIINNYDGENLKDNIYHIYTVFAEKRDELQKYLTDNGVQTQIHYPIPPHKQECYKEWNHLSLPVTEQIHAKELSLPMSPAMPVSDAMKVVKLITKFVTGK